MDGRFITADMSVGSTRVGFWFSSARLFHHADTWPISHSLVGRDDLSIHYSSESVISYCHGKAGFVILSCYCA